MTLQGMEGVALVAGATFLMALGFAIYFKIQERREKHH